jgi:GxxExxY protein
MTVLHVGMHINDVSGQVVDAAMKVHSALGPGLLEAAYQVCVSHELRSRGLAVRREVLIPVRYDGVVLNVAYRIDLLVEECVVVEIKAVAKNHSGSRGAAAVSAQAR